MATIVELTPELCESVVTQNGVVLLYFKAEWCGFCKTMNRILDQVAAETPDELLIAKCNIEQCAECAAAYEVTSVPRLVIFKDGAEIKRINGSIGKGPLLKELLPLLDN